MKKKFTIALCTLLGLTLGSIPTFSQNPNIATPSAGSMSLVNSIQSSINYPTGKANIQIPLFNLRYFGIQVPISIAYNTSGIRIEDQAGEVGLGWRFIAGGKITRIVKQRPDKTNSIRWGSMLLPLANDFFKTIDSKYKYYNQIDSEPDLFYFEIPGASGMFVLDSEGKAHTIPYQNISIQRIESLNNEHFIIMDPQGNIYEFGMSASARETTKTTFSNENIQPKIVWENILPEIKSEETISYISTWHLERIKGYNGEEIIFSYMPGSTQKTISKNYTFTYYSEKIYQVPHKDWKTKDKTSTTTILTSTCFLSSIMAGEQKVYFEKYSTNTVYGNSIGKIAYTIGTDFKKFLSLKYELFAQDRIFLTSIIDDHNATLYSFEYNKNRLLPAFDSKDYDSWGYYNYNGISSNTTHMPEGDYRDWAGIRGNITLPQFANRNPNLESTKACILTTVKNNLGGKIEYVYGLNKDDTYGTLSGGLRIEEIKHYDGINSIPLVTKYQYLNDYGGSSAYVVNTPRHSVRDFITRDRNYLCDPLILSSKPFYSVYDEIGNSIIYSQISEIAPDGSKIVYEYTHPGDTDCANKSGIAWWYRITEMTDITYDSNQDVLPDPRSYMRETSRFWRHCLLKRVRNIDAAGNLVQNTEYKYKLNLPNKKVITGYIPYYKSYYYYGLGSSDSYFLFEYEWESQPVYLEKIINHATAYSPESSTVYTYDTDYMVPTTIIQKDAENNEIKTELRYTFNLNITNSHIYVLTKSGVVLPVETIKYINNKVVSAELTEYTSYILKSESIGNDNGYPQVMISYITLPKNKYYMPFQSQATSIVKADYQDIDGVNNRLVYDSRYKLSETFDYDSQGNVLSICTPEGHKNSVVYAEDRSATDPTNMILAEVSNAIHTVGNSNRTNQVYYTSFENNYSSDKTGTKPNTLNTELAKTGKKVCTDGTFSVSLSDFIPGAYILTYWKSTDKGKIWQKITENITVSASTFSTLINNDGWIDEVRIIPVDARMKTYAFKIGIGMTSETDHNGVTTYREYDSFGRIIKVLNSDRQVLEQYEYNIKK